MRDFAANTYNRGSTEYFKLDIALICIYVKIYVDYGWQSSSGIKITVEECTI